MGFLPVEEVCRSAQPVQGGEGRNRAPNVLLTAKIDRFFRLIKHNSPTTPNYTSTAPLLTLPLTVDLLTIAQCIGMLSRVSGAKTAIMPSPALSRATENIRAPEGSTGFPWLSANPQLLCRLSLRRQTSQGNFRIFGTADSTCDPGAVASRPGSSRHQESSCHDRLRAGRGKCERSGPTTGS
jgi:hypothetical protein